MATTTNLAALAIVLVSLALLFGCAQQPPAAGGTPSAGGTPAVGGGQPGGTAPPAQVDTSAVQQDLDSYDSGLEESIAEVEEAG